LCLALSAHRAAAVDLDALIGFGPAPTLSSHYRPDDWTPVTVYLTGQGVSGVGQLQVTVRSGERAVVYARRVPLHEGALDETAHFVVILRSPDMYSAFRGSGIVSDINIQLLKDGRKLAEKNVSLPTGTNPETYNVLALTRDGSGMNFLLKKKLGLVHRHFNPVNIQRSSPFMGRFPGMNGQPGADTTGANGINPDANLQVLYTDPRALPGTAQGYAMIDAVALADQPLDNLTEDQTAALEGFVRSGGLLIISGGGDLPRLKSQLIADLLPVTPTGVVSVHDLPELTQRYRNPVALPEGTALTNGTLKPGAITLFGTVGASAPLISARPYGCGMVVFTAFDFTAPEFRGWKGAPALWRDLLRCGNETISPRDILAHHSLSGPGENTQLADALAGKQATNAPDFWTIAGFIGAYLFLLIPFSYFVLKKLDKRELAWVTAPILILAFTVGSYVIALSIKGGMLTVNRAAVVETIANSDQAAGYAQMTLYSPRRAAYDIAVGNPDDPNNPYRDTTPGEIFADRNDRLAGDLTIDQDKTATIRDATVKLWDKRSFDTPLIPQLGGPIAARTRMIDARTAQVTITNQTRYALKDCFLVNPQESVPIGDLAPGQTQTKTIQWVSHGGATSLSVPVTPETRNAPSFDPTRHQPDTPEMARDKIRTALAASLATGTENSYNYYGVDMGTYGRADNAFVGWFSDPILDVRVDGNPANGEEVNLLYAHLPVPENAPPSVRAARNPFLQKPFLNLEDEQGPATRKGGIFR
jgi:hypothetical protein